MSPSSRKATLHYRKIKANPISDEDAAKLLETRVVCGWKAEQVPRWIEEIGKGDRFMWFIYDDENYLQSDTVSPVGTIGVNLFKLDDLTVANFNAPLQAKGDRAELTSVFIYPNYRRRGYATEAIRYVEDVMTQLGVGVMTLHTRATSEGPEMYTKMGYHVYKGPEKKFPLPLVLSLGGVEADCYALYMEKRLLSVT